MVADFSPRTHGRIAQHLDGTRHGGSVWNDLQAVNFDFSCNGELEALPRAYAVADYQFTKVTELPFNFLPSFPASRWNMSLQMSFIQTQFFLKLRRMAAGRCPTPSTSTSPRPRPSPGTRITTQTSSARWAPTLASSSPVGGQKLKKRADSERESGHFTTATARSMPEHDKKITILCPSKCDSSSSSSRGGEGGEGGERRSRGM